MNGRKAKLLRRAAILTVDALGGQPRRLKAADGVTWAAGTYRRTYRDIKRLAKRQAAR